MRLKTDGAKIRELRERKALTLTEFAGLLGYAVNSVHLIEVGKSNGGPKFIRAAARILDCRITDIAHDLQNNAVPARTDYSEPTAGTQAAPPTGHRDQGSPTRQAGPQFPDE